MWSKSIGQREQLRYVLIWPANLTQDLKVSAFGDGSTNSDGLLLHGTGLYLDGVPLQSPDGNRVWIVESDDPVRLYWVRNTADINVSLIEFDRICASQFWQNLVAPQPQE